MVEFSMGVSSMRYSVKKLITAMVFGLGLALAACGGPTSSACDDSETVGRCTNVKYCCSANLTSATCYYEANGKKYSCSNSVDCAKAAQDLAKDCE